MSSLGFLRHAVGRFDSAKHPRARGGKFRRTSAHAVTGIHRSNNRMTGVFDSGRAFRKRPVRTHLYRPVKPKLSVKHSRARTSKGYSRALVYASVAHSRGGRVH